MLDYRAIAALNAIIETQGFEAAAQKLFITQSAVSQRIASLEKFYGKPVVLRTQPYTPTELGKLLLGHYKRLSFLESSLKAELTSEIDSPTISIAISRDSLDTWFINVIDELKSLMPINLEIIADDQEMTLDYLRKGLVTACVSTSSEPITGCQSHFIGFFDYTLVASPSFYKKYFSNKKNLVDNLLTAPSIIFDNKDHLHANYFKKYFDMEHAKFNQHIIPSVAGFRQFALKGYAYALIPKIDVINDIKQKKLIPIFPDKIWEMPQYWHSWAIDNKVKQAFDQIVFKVSRETLRY